MKLNLSLLFVAAHAAGVLAARGPHPAGRAGDNDLIAQDCWAGAPTGCTDGYCWKSCDASGAWCWTALDGGNGDWKACDDATNCDDDDGSDCAMGDCADCGCSC